MSYDFSQIGLDGQQAYATRMSTLAQARTNNANATAQDLENVETNKMVKLNEIASGALQGGQVNSQDPNDAAARIQSLADPIETVANVYLAGGAIAKGTELITKASEIRKRESDIKNDGFTAQKTRLGNIITGADIVSRWIGGAKNQDEWNLGMQEIGRSLERGDFVMEPEMFEKIKAMPYDPDAAAFFSERALDAKAKAELELKDRTEVRLSDNASVSQQQAQTRIELQAIRDADMKANRDRLTKIAGDKVAALGVDSLQKVDASVVNNTLASQVFPGVKNAETDPAFKSSADYVTMLAKQEMKDNKGISWYTAVQRSVMRAQHAGVIAGTPGETRIFGANVEPKAKFNPAGTTVDRPLSPPVGANGSVDPKALRVGMYYKLQGGQIGKWNGKGIVVD